jgi:predicted RNA-binding protein with RPS1 domain
VDVGCHEEGFVHVSCLADTFVKDVAAHVKKGDAVDVRVVSFDKRKKRLTLSMQSDAVVEKLAKEKKEYDERETKRKGGKERGKKLGKKEAAVVKQAPEGRAQPTIVIPKSAARVEEVEPAEKEREEEVDESKMSKDELKRHLKIKRRAAARAEREAAAAAE